MAYDGFEAIREEEIICPIIEPRDMASDDLQLVTTSTPPPPPKPRAMASDDLQLVTSTPPPPPKPQVNTKRSKKNVKQSRLEKALGVGEAIGICLAPRRRLSALGAT